MSDQLKGIEKVISNGISERQTLINFNLGLIDEKTTFDKKEVLALVTKIQERHDVHLSEVTNLTKCSLENFSQQQEIWQSKQSELVTAMKEKDFLVSEFTKELNGSIEAFTKETKAKFDLECQKTNEAVSAQENEIETLQTTLSEFYSNMTSMIDKARTNLQDIKGGTSRMAENHESIGQKMNEWTKEIQNHGKQYQTYVLRETKTNQDFRQQASDTLNTNKSVINQIQDSSNRVTSDVKSSLTNLGTQVNSTFDYISTSLHSQKTDICELDAKISKTSQEKLMESNDLIQKCNSCVNGVVTNTASLLNCFRKGIVTHEKETKNHLLKISDDAETFRRNEVKKYQPTGMTPARKEYRIVRDLAATSPHERIVRKFKLDNTGGSDLDSSIVSEVIFMFFL